jgi:hypothetical protein
MRGSDHVLVAFMQDEPPCYVRPQQLLPMGSRPLALGDSLPAVINVDALLGQWVQTSQQLLCDLNEPLMLIGPHAVPVARARQCAIWLLLLGLVANHVVPPVKLGMLVEAVAGLTPPKYAATAVLTERCTAKIKEILDTLG